MRRGGFFRRGVFLVLLCAGCAPRADTVPPEAPNANLNLALDTQPRPPSALDPTTFTVRVSDAARQPVSGADVVLRLTMPAMPMGENRVTMAPGAAGTYTGRGRFTMAGAWQATVTAAKAKQSATQTFSIGVR